MEHDKKGSNPAGRISFLFCWLYTNKILKGRDLKDGEFQFELLELVDDEAVVIAKGTHGAASAGKASAVDFGKITYDAPGEHDYLIREVVPSGGRDADTVYDTRSYSVHVSVTDQKDGTLKVTSDASGDEPMTFLNKQASKNPSGGMIRTAAMAARWQPHQNRWTRLRSAWRSCC